eukprot:CAMPEP_0113504868 /NCGR_PEP_ID=MMETSP0014_2-20120614/34967_1 /TAXON_ID=2857 /ORGANISM="Nitzschia sp." /LENGTH=623 /DNA_ID=CAMNT_0000400051 /DNA_START=63 /DNA_END=1934 /DNA_ORIENTATION=- /assembly_acc=CAM_ASM_000159
MVLLDLAIVHKGGVVLFESLNEASGSTSQSLSHTINTWITDFYTNPTCSRSDQKNYIDVTSSTSTAAAGGGGGSGSSNKVVVEWYEPSSFNDDDLIVLAVYPDLRHGDMPWVQTLLKAVVAEYNVFLRAMTQQDKENGSDEEDDEDDDENDPLSSPRRLLMFSSPDNQRRFDKTFQVLLQKHRTTTAATATNSTAGSTMSSQNVKSSSGDNANTTSNNKSKSGGKEKRHWHDGKAKVTKEAMAELDRSKAVTDDEIQKSEEDALAEARAAYLPTDADLAADLSMMEPEIVDDDDGDDGTDGEGPSSWGSSLQGMFQQMTGQKVLTNSDLDKPIQEIHKMLTSKNVAADIATKICDRVRSNLVGQRLNSMYRVKTAVRQALEQVINELLESSTQLDLLREVVAKRDAGMSSFFNKNNQRRPYVIVVVGLNGVGKSTSLAKLAYYLKTNGCTPLLAACDTFRSGAVEQLAVHAKCLELPLYSKGYSKDPSTVANLAIEEATKNGNDVVLVDTAGRMQNNLPLMKALGKLAAENRPDMVVFVGEALVGNDGVDQVKMFDKAISYQNKSQKVNSILLTKFDTVSDKVGAALTMTHVTNAPILFVGTGQKYHHLQKLSTAAVIRSLFR